MRDRAFTLIEMITLLIIIAVLSAAAVPYYARLRDHADFQRAVGILQGELADARNAAIQAGADCIVRFDPQIDVFEVIVEVADPSADSPAAMLDQSEQVHIPPPRTVGLGEDIAVQEFRPLINQDSQLTNSAENRALTEIRFHEDGSSDGGSIVLISPHGYGARLQIAPQTGAISVQQQEDLDEIQ